MRYLLGPLVVFMVCFHYISMMNTPRPPRQRIISNGQLVEEKPIRPRKNRNQQVEENPPPTRQYRSRRVGRHYNFQLSNPNIHQIPEHMSTFQQDTENYNIRPFTEISSGPEQNNGLHMGVDDNGLIQFTNQRCGPSQDNYSPGPNQHQGYMHYLDSPNLQTNHPNYQNDYPPQSFEANPVLYGYSIRPAPYPSLQQPRTHLHDVQDDEARYMYEHLLPSLKYHN